MYIYIYIYSIIVVYTQFLVVINLFHREFNGIQWNLYIHDVWIPDVEWMIIPHIIWFFDHGTLIALYTLYHISYIELDDGKIFTGKPDQFDGKNHGFPVPISPNKPTQWIIHIDILTVDFNGSAGFSSSHLTWVYFIRIKHQTLRLSNFNGI